LRNEFDNDSAAWRRIFHGTNLEHHLIKKWEVADIPCPWGWDTREGEPMRLIVAYPRPTALDGLSATPSIPKFVSIISAPSRERTLRRAFAHPLQPQHFRVT
jgi:hypothetical protein